MKTSIMKIGGAIVSLSYLPYSVFAQSSTALGSNSAVKSAGASSPTPLNPCEALGQAEASYSVANPQATETPTFPALDALACLDSVPLDVKRSSAFIDYITPYLEFQSTLAYLKDPPVGYTLPGVDILGGLATINAKLQSGGYKSQYAFEKDLYVLVNVLPHDFHLTLELVLPSLFSFSNLAELVSVSTDGVNLPQPYFLSDLESARSSSTFTWAPSHITLIDSQPVTDLLLYTAQTTDNYQGPDALYNDLFFSIPTRLVKKGNNYLNGGAHKYGFTAANTTFTFANGTSRSLHNVASAAISLKGIDSGAALFKAFETPSDTTTSSSSSSTTTSTTAVTSALGYPTPVVLHPKGYVGGYFLPNSSIAVLSINSFAPSPVTGLLLADQEQQSVIQTFLENCTAGGKTKLIIDLSANGGGSIWNGFDAFKQLFPTLEPFGASRFQYTAVVDYMGAIFGTGDGYNVASATVYHDQDYLDVNGQDFPDWRAVAGPDTIYHETLASLVRYNFSDPTFALQNGIVVSGYGNRTNLAPQAFAAEDMVMVYDGLCGSTCAIFSELMKSQGNVRSIALGGRPQYSPMQGVGGSKGSQDLDVSAIQSYIEEAAYYADLLASQNTSLPTPPPANSIPSLTTPPLGAKLSGSINLRNNYHDANPDSYPLQFIYEASNCRLFYTPDEIFSIAKVWTRIADVAWGSGKCVPGSTVNIDGTFPVGAYDTVAFGPGAMSNVTLPSDTVGLVTGMPMAGNASSNGSAPTWGSAPISNTASNLHVSLAAGVVTSGMFLMML